MKAIFLFLVVCFTLGVHVFAQVPCHRNKNKIAAWGCQMVTLPKNMCKTCQLKPVASNGNFKDCKSIYNLDAPACYNSLKEYVSLNPCDTKRKQQVYKMKNGQNFWEKKIAKEDLDYMVYSLCEQCCDCIPKKSSNVPFWKAKQSENLLYDSSRGNCAAHAHFDICKLFPSIKFFRAPGGAYHWWWPKICWQLKSWVNNNKNWLQQNNAKTNWPITRFLRNVNRNTACGDATVWNKCKAMEAAQNRI